MKALLNDFNSISVKGMVDLESIKPARFLSGTIFVVNFPSGPPPQLYRVYRGKLKSMTKPDGTLRHSEWRWLHTQESFRLTKDLKGFEPVFMEVGERTLAK